MKWTHHALIMLTITSGDSDLLIELGAGALRVLLLVVLVTALSGFMQLKGSAIPSVYSQMWGTDG